MKTLWKRTLQLWLFGFAKVPLIFWLRPRVLSLSAEKAVVMIPLKRRAKNHFNSMYFGALCVGADIAGGIQVMNIIGGDLKKISFVFKDVKGEFLKRPEADVHFTCTDGQVVRDIINKSMQSKERENAMVTVNATTPSLSQDEVVARFTLTLSVKYRA
ncbi:MAG: PaaI family thioesterase [Candidatus Berkiella sp.]